jgi:hypothetical protein
MKIRLPRLRLAAEWLVNLLLDVAIAVLSFQFGKALPRVRLDVDWFEPPIDEAKLHREWNDMIRGYADPLFSGIDRSAYPNLCERDKDFAIRKSNPDIYATRPQGSWKHFTDQLIRAFVDRGLNRDQVGVVHRELNRRNHVVDPLSPRSLT